MLNCLDTINNLSKKELMFILKREADNLCILDYIKASEFLRADSQFIPSSYRKEFVESYTNAFITSLNFLKNDKNDYCGNVNTDNLRELLTIIMGQQKSVDDENEVCFYKFSGIISVYKTFILDEPIHPVGTPFPGGLKVKMENGEYLCPVKEKQKDNPNAVCLFCIAEQDPEL